MKLGLHQFANDELQLKLEFENDTEREIVGYFFKNCESITGSADGHNGIYISTKKKLK